MMRTRLLRSDKCYLINVYYYHLIIFSTKPRSLTLLIYNLLFAKRKKDLAFFNAIEEITERG